MSAPFWERLTLEEMSRDQWESLCDGCAQCCRIKLEDEEAGALAETAVVCALLDQESCRCSAYETRSIKVPDCVTLTPEAARTLTWMPESCAYRRLAEGRGLPPWHPLITGEPESVHEAGASVRGQVLSEDAVHPDDLEAHIIRWVTP